MWGRRKCRNILDLSYKILKNKTEENIRPVQTLWIFKIRKVCTRLRFLSFLLFTILSDKSGMFCVFSVPSRSFHCTAGGADSSSPSASRSSAPTACFFRDRNNLYNKFRLLHRSTFSNSLFSTTKKRTNVSFSNWNFQKWKQCEKYVYRHCEFSKNTRSVHVLFTLFWFLEISIWKRKIRPLFYWSSPRSAGASPCSGAVLSVPKSSSTMIASSSSFPCAGSTITAFVFCLMLSLASQEDFSSSFKVLVAPSLPRPAP